MIGKCYNTIPRGCSTLIYQILITFSNQKNAQVFPNTVYIHVTNKCTVEFTIYIGVQQLIRIKFMYEPLNNTYGSYKANLCECTNEEVRNVKFYFIQMFNVHTGSLLKCQKSRDK
jgi:hypothetical protein